MTKDKVRSIGCRNHRAPGAFVNASHNYCSIIVVLGIGRPKAGLKAGLKADLKDGLTAGLTAGLSAGRWPAYRPASR